MTLVVGVDTHAATHTFAAVHARTGAEVDHGSFPTTAAGLLRACAWIDRRVAAPARVLVVVEGTGSYGAVLTERLTFAGRIVVEAPTMTRAAVRGVGKTDLLDAVRIARSVLGFPADRLRVPRADGDRAALRVLVVAREQMSTERTRTPNALVALVRTIDLEVDARRPLTKAQVRTIPAWRNHNEPGVRHRGVGSD